MKIDTNTINVLKNFSKINPSIVISEGNVLKTISPTKTIMAKATVGTEFPRRFAIYSLDTFLALVSSYTDPDLKFSKDSVKIGEDTRYNNFVYADETTVTKAPDKEINIPSVDVSFHLTQSDLKEVEKQCGILNVPEMVIVGDGTNILLKAMDSKNPTGSDYSAIIGETNKTFKAVFKIDNIKLMPGNYDVTISSRGISKFQGDNIEYFVAVEQNSVF